MAWQTIAELDIPPLFETLYQQGQISDNSFSIYLTDTIGDKGGKLVIGGVNPAYAASEFRYFPLSSQTYWAIGLDDIKLDDTSYGVQDMVAIVDSGTSLIAGDKKIIDKMKAKFPTQINCTDFSGLPTLTFVLSGFEYTLQPKDYIVSFMNGDQLQCILGIAGINLPSQLSNLIILGDVFIRNYYTHFDYGKSRLGLAASNRIKRETA
eukprot:TRINITY_DN6971_c0_g1_i3.p2 TRINITY_DN6971_c0_g1~~TRINITY_DN6971_c0_g1_i3.p2  ORF type:complete len:208 (-),score=53.93 TRINITY_DN6971_c0_g1_i3:149-772(-)